MGVNQFQQSYFRNQFQQVQTFGIPTQKENQFRQAELSIQFQQETFKFQQAE